MLHKIRIEENSSHEGLRRITPVLRSNDIAGSFEVTVKFASGETRGKGSRTTLDGRVFSSRI